MPDLFISYARGDSRDFVTRLSAALEEGGKDAWVDLDDIPPASSWNDDLRAGIAASDSFAFVISPASVASPHCRSELEHALGLGKRILPVLHLPVPDDQVPEAVATRNWIPQLGRFTDDFNTSLATLVTAMETDLDWVCEHTRWGLRAEEWERRGEDRSLLARGSDLDQAEAFIGGGGAREPAPTALQGRYVVASRRAATRRQRQLVTGVSIALVVAIVLGVLALIQRNTAVEQRHRAEDQRARATSRALAANAFLNLPTDPELSVLLGLEAAKASPTTEAESALRSGILDDRVRATLQHQRPVYAAAYSPDGTRIVTASADRTAALWDAATGTKIADLTGATQPVLDAKWSADGSRVVTRSDDGTARVWDGQTGALISAVSLDADLTDVVISADGKVIATSTFTLPDVYVWDATTGRRNATIPAQGVDRMALTPDDGELLLALQGGQVELWRTRDLTLVDRWPDGQESFPTALVVSPDGSRFASAWGDGTVMARHLDGSPLGSVRHGDVVEAVAFSPDGTLVGTASDDGTAKVTALDGGGSTAVTFTGHDGQVRSIAFSPDGSTVATGGEDGHVELWRAGTGALVASLTGHHGPVNSVVFSPDGARLLSASDDSTARVWSTSPSGGAFEASGAVPLGNADQPGISDNGRYGEVEVEKSAGYAVATIDLRSGEVRDGFTLYPSEFLLRGVSPDGTLVVTSDGERALLRHASDGTVVATLDLPGAEAAAFDPTGDRVVVTGSDGAAAVFDARDGHRLATLKGHAAGEDVGGVVFSPDGRRVATASSDGTARVWDAGSGKQLLSLPAFGPRTPQATALARVVFSPDGQRLFTAVNWENRARLWDLRTGDELATLEGSGGGIFGAAFSPSGRFLVTGEFLGDIRLWDGLDGRPLSFVATDPISSEAVTFGPAERSVLAIVRAGDPEHGELRTYSCDVCGGLDSLVELARSRVTRGLTDTEKATYLGNR